MIRLLATAALATIWTVWGIGVAALVTALLLLAYAIGLAWMTPHRPTPRTITRLPTQHERRWSWGIGVALTWFGPLPFITIRRRMGR